MLKQSDFEDNFDVRSWLASSTVGDGSVNSAIVNVKASWDRRYNVKMYIYWDYSSNKYNTERA